MRINKEMLLDDILNKFYESKVAKEMGYITGVERFCLEVMAKFIIDSGWKSPQEWDKRLGRK